MRASVFFGGTREPVVGSRVFPVQPRDKSFVRAKADTLSYYYYRLYSVLLCVRHTPLVRIVKTHHTADSRGFSIHFVCYFIYIFRRRFHTVVVHRFGLVGSFNLNYVKTNHARGALACCERAAPRFGRCPKSDDDAFLFCIRYKSEMHSTPACVADKREFKYF